MPDNTSDPFRRSQKKLTAKQREAIDDLKNQAMLLHHEMVELCPDGREKSLALTRLEESIMWATKSLSA